MSTSPKTFTRLLTTLAVAGVLLSACGGSGGASPGQDQAPAGPPDEAAAQEEGKVVVYTSVDTKALEAINAAFTEKYGIEVEYFRGDSQDAISRLLSESRAGGAKADVIETSDTPGMIFLGEEGLTTPYVSAEAAEIPDEYKDPEGLWTYTRLTLGVIAYRPDKVEAPTSWAQLSEEPYRSQLALFSDSQGSGAARLWTLAEELGWDTIESWGEAEPLRVETPQLLRQTLERGERAVGIAQNDNHALSSRADTDGAVDFAIPEEGVPLEPAAIGLVTDSPHPNAGKLYLDFWLSEEGMEILVDVGKKYVSRDGVGHPEGAEPLEDIPLILPDYEAYAEQRGEALGRLQTIFGGEWGQ
ncbi:ABC transporter substrate-binding protein [Ornithinimicrobium cavernae]|uniref:ABC transporter substrate-binding protein n=1 Tax=Ornithinimicrobium cavernae TaxID=2666047 RepID=UPI000D691852|nr:extracellular solute-binding protein [Ornithinimicrobium cavernae]